MNQALWIKSVGDVFMKNGNADMHKFHVREVEQEEQTRKLQDNWGKLDTCSM